MDISERCQDSIDDIMDNFDFKRVHDVMEAVEWSWHYYGVPEESDIRKEARRLLKDVASKKHCIVATGGLEAHYDKDEDMCGLKFVVTDWFPIQKE